MLRRHMFYAGACVLLALASPTQAASPQLRKAGNLITIALPVAAVGVARNREAGDDASAGPVAGPGSRC